MEEEKCYNCGKEAEPHTLIFDRFERVPPRRYCKTCLREKMKKGTIK